jgi:bifunctional oligoribonuclease and PAP phosphatase NrnA
VTDTINAAVNSFEAAADLLQGAGRLAVMAHLNPDADAIGSVLGMTLGLRALGKTVTPVLSDPVPDYAMHLDGAREICSQLPPAANLDLIVCLDSAGIDRVGRVYEEQPDRFSGAVVNIDHHRTNPLYGRVNWVEGGASSTSEMVFRMLLALDAPVDASAANALLFGIMGDTGAFQNGATTPGSLQVAARLVELGADSQRTAYYLFERKRFAAARLWGRMIAGIELDPERHIVFCFMTQRMLIEAGATVDETEGVAEYLRGVEEAETVMLLKENPDATIRVSMRSRPAVDVSAIATALGGGGHRQAAGCTLPGPMGEARRLLIEAYEQFAAQ